MTDVVLGMGEIGETLFDLLEERGIDCVGIDAESTKCKNLKRVKLLRPEYLHVCLTRELSNFEKIIEDWTKKIGNIKNIAIHSTVRPETTRKIQHSCSTFTSKRSS